MQHEKPDLIVSDLLTEYPARKLIIRMEDIHPGRLTLLESLDMMEASGIPSSQFVTVMVSGSMRDKARLMYALAWVIARRAEPDLTYEEVCTYQLDVVGKSISDANAKERAEAVVGVAALAGVSTEDAKQMTIAEVQATIDLHKRRTARRTPAPRRKRVG